MLGSQYETKVSVMTNVTTYLGGCHCENIQIEYSSCISPSDTEVRECQCSFCRKHATRAIADPSGSLVITITNPADVSRYSFGMRTAQYLVCRECGVYAAAITNDTTEPKGIAILNALADASAFTSPPIPADYSAESQFYRQARRRHKWTPAKIEVSKLRCPL